MNTRISKGREGWEAKTTIELGADNRVLVISTSKTHGGLVTNQQVMKTDPQGYMSYVLFQDFSKRLVHTGVRCTEKTVRELHQQALAVSDALIAEALGFYAAKEGVAA